MSEEQSIPGAGASDDNQVYEPAELAGMWLEFTFTNDQDTVMIKDFVEYCFEEVIRSGPECNFGIFSFKDSAVLEKVKTAIDYDKMIGSNSDPDKLAAARQILFRLTQIMSIDGLGLPKLANRSEKDRAIAEIIESSKLFLKTES